jgi:hypothetical protein
LDIFAVTQGNNAEGQQRTLFRAGQQQQQLEKLKKSATQKKFKVPFPIFCSCFKPKRYPAVTLSSTAHNQASQQFKSKIKTKIKTVFLNSTAG